MPRLHSGFTLIELVVVMIVIAVGLLGISKMFGDNISTLVVGEDAQRAAQYAQECTEMVLAQRRSLGYLSVTTSSCDGASLPTGFTRTVALTTSTGTSTSACPDGGSCTAVLVTVSKGNASGAMTVMLADY